MIRREPLRLPWTKERVEQLRKLWSEGLSCSQIAGRLGGCTRNAVISKVNREGLPQRGHAHNKLHKRPASKNQQGFNGRRGKPKDAKPFQILKPEPIPEPTDFDRARLEDKAKPVKSFDDLADYRECKFPIDAKRDEKDVKLFCALPTVVGLPYCETHAVRCYRPVEVRERPDPALVPNKEKVFC